MVIVLVTLLLLTILGTTVFMSSTSELRISGNYRNDIESFYNADASMEYSQTLSTIYTALGTSDAWPAPGTGKNLTTNEDSPAGYRNYNVFQLDPAGTKTALIKVETLTRGGGLPPGFGTEEDSGVGLGGSGAKYAANYYVVSVIGNGPNNAKSELESQIVKVVPK